jgi:hypothetical protein
MNTMTVVIDLIQTFIVVSPVIGLILDWLTRLTDGPAGRVGPRPAWRIAVRRRRRRDFPMNDRF